MAPFTARQIVEIIQHNCGVAPRADTVDTFKCGDPDARVRGVAVTMMPTLEVLQRAVEENCNFVIAHEPAFYGHRDDVSVLQRENDAVWATKRDFIAANDLVLWRFHDLPHWHNPDLIARGMSEELGWDAWQNPADDRLFALPATSLGELARQIRDRLQIRTLRVVGDADLSVCKVALAPGAPGFDAHRRLLQNPRVEVLIIGEAPEWETIAYAADAAAAHNKALIILGHIPSEEGGMKSCARWLQRLLPDVCVTFIATPEPFWTPAN